MTNDPKRALHRVLGQTAVHARGVLAQSQSPVPWPHMMICGLTTSLPVFVGLLRGELGLSIYGALAGYLITLNDHFGSLRHRLLITAVSFTAMAVAFTLGLDLRGHPTAFITVVMTLTYWLGLMGGTGAEVERLLLFSVIDVVIVYYQPAVTTASGPGILAYGIFALLIIFAGQCLSDRFAARHRNATFAKMLPSLRRALTRQGARHRYAVNYLLATGLAILAVDRFAIERGYWMVITVLLVMRPDFKDSVYRNLQRLFGTLLGVTIGDLLILFINVKALLVLGVAAAAFAVPYGLKRNYWLVSFFATILVVLFLTLPTSGVRDVHVPFVRLLATVYGCGLSVMVTILSAVISRLSSALRRPLVVFICGVGTLTALAPRADAAIEYDLYRPKAPGPLVIFVHGGAWVSGGRAQYANFGRALAVGGWCVAVIDYRLAPATRHPGPVEDLEAARAKLSAATEPLCDTKRVILMGHSAGAHAIAYWATLHRTPVRGFIGLEGIYDLPSLAKRFPDYVEWFLTKAFGSADAWTKASPTLRPVINSAPWLLVHSPADELVDPAQTDHFAAHLRGKPEVVKPAGLTHSGVLEELITRDSVLNRALAAFLKRVAS